MAQLKYRKSSTTYTCELYTSVGGAWETYFNLRYGGATYYVPLTSNLSHINVTDLRVRKSGTTYGFLSSEDISGQLWGWGANSAGQIGDLSTAHRSSPVQVGSATNWSDIASGESHVTQESNSAAVKDDGTLWTWGRNTEGALGTAGTAFRSSPVQVGSDTNWMQVACGRNGTSAIKTTGTLWGAGYNFYGQIGNGGTSNIINSFVQVGSLTNWKQVARGLFHTLAVKTDGTLWAWGENNNGQLGHGDTVNRSSPVQVGSLTNWKQVECGDYYSLAIKTDGTAWAWGENAQGQLGQGDIVYRSSPVQIGSLTDWRFIGGGFAATFLINTSGELWSIGQGGNGVIAQLDLISRSSPVQVGSDTNWLQVNAGGGSGAAVKTDGTLWTWGSSAYGSLGTGVGTGNNASSPVQVGSLTTWKKVVVGEHLTLLAIRN